MDRQSSWKSVQPESAESRRDERLSAALAQIGELSAALIASEARERALYLELQHRVRNLLSVIRSIYRRSRESDSSEENFAEHFEGRLGAIARYQSHFDGSSSVGFDLENMVRDELLEARCIDGPNCTLNGPPVVLQQRTAELIGLALHELTTNAIKFGALAQGGHLAIAWAVAAEGMESWLDFHWTETGVPVAGTAPRPNGFGQQLIEEALPYQLGARTALEFRPGGAVCTILLSLPPIAPGAQTTGEALLASEKDDLS